MAGRWTSQINKIIRGMNYLYGIIYLIETEQFYSKDQKRAITMFKLSRQQDNKRVQIMKTANQLDILLYLAEQLKEMKANEPEGTGD